MLKQLVRGAALLSALFLLIACGASKEGHQQRLILQDAEARQGKDLKFPVPVIKKDDLLTIMVYSDNKEATDIFNQAQGMGSGGANVSGGAMMSTTGRGYLVDKEGEIFFHALGKVKAEGLTRNELADQLSGKLRTFLQNPYVTVRFTNARVTVLGEVMKPGAISMPDQKLSVLDAIGLSGDLTLFARRDNILVIREKEGKQEIGRLDLRKTDFYDSPFFYLQQNDMVYVEPTRKKPTGNEQVLMRNIAIGTSVLSVLTFVATIILR